MSELNFAAASQALACHSMVICPADRQLPHMDKQIYAIHIVQHAQNDCLHPKRHAGQAVAHCRILRQTFLCVHCPQRGLKGKLVSVPQVKVSESFDATCPAERIAGGAMLLANYSTMRGADRGFFGTQDSVDALKGYISQMCLG